MSNKQELAALMASDGDFEKKISLLKKAVVTVTKQKQEVEGRQTQLQDELRSTTQQLMEAQRENTVLQRKVKTLEGQLEQERSSGSAFGQNMLKGLSSIMGNNDAGGRGGRGGRGGNSGAGRGAQQLALSAEDMERLVTENEQLHREKYTYKTKMEDAQRISSREAEKLKSDVDRLQKEVAELQSSLTAATATCDRYNADYLAERALGDFCRHFFVASLRYGDTERGGEAAALAAKVELRWPAKQQQQQPSFSSGSMRSSFSPSSLADVMPSVVREQAAMTLQSATGTVKTLLRGVSVLAVVLREQLPRRERATVGDLERLRERLSVFLEAHTIKKDRLMYLLELLEGQLSALLAQHPSAGDGGGSGTAGGERHSANARRSESGSSGQGVVETAESFVTAQDEVLQLFSEWVGLLRAQLPLLIESCVSYLPQGHTYALHAVPSTKTESSAGAAGDSTSRRTTTDRAEFVEEVTKYGYAALASVEGSLAAVRMLVQRSPTAYCLSSSPTKGGGSREDGEAEEKPAWDGGLTAATAAPPSDGTLRTIDVTSLLALQQFWWEGCLSARALHTSARVLDSSLEDVAEACNKSEVRDALHYLCRCLRVLSMASDHLAREESDAATVIEALPPAKWLAGGSTAVLPPSPCPSRAGAVAAGGAMTTRGGNDGRRPSPPASADTYEELLVALAAADRAATTYYTQMNHLYMEMADREDALQTAVEAAHTMKELLEMEKQEAEQTRQTMQNQISVLSNQLIHYTNAELAQPMAVGPSQ